MRKGAWALLFLPAALLILLLLLRGEETVPPPVFPGPLPASRTTGAPAPAPPALPTEPVKAVPDGKETEAPEVPHALVLVVRSKETGAPEPGASAWLAVGEEWNMAPYPVHPGTETARGRAHAADAEGRIALPAGIGEARVAVRAPWSAWALLVVPYAVGEATVELVPGGTVKLIVENWGELEEANIFSGPGLLPHEVVVEPGGGADGPGSTTEVREEGGRAMEPVPSPGEDGSILLEGLPCGPRTFEVLRGEWWMNGDRYGAASRVVVAGEVREVTIPTTPTKAGARAPIEGTVTIAEEWGWGNRAGDGLRMEIRGEQPTNATVRVDLDLLGPFEEVPFKTVPIPPGKYSVEIQEYGWGTEIEVPEGGARYAWTVPAPATLRLRLVDAVTGKAIEDADLSARTEEGGDRSRSGPGEDGEFVLKVVPGKWEVTCSAEGYQETTALFEATGPTEFRRTVAMRPAATITVLLRLDGQPWDGSARVEVVRDFAEDGELGRELEEKEAGGVLSGKGTSTRSGTCSFDGITPGKWVVKVKPLPGFEPLPEKPIQATQGGAFEVTYDLVRAK